MANLEFSNFSSLALTVWEFLCFEDLEENDDLINELLSYEGVCRTAPSTQGLLIIMFGETKSPLERLQNCVALSLDFKTRSE